MVRCLFSTGANTPDNRDKIDKKGVRDGQGQGFVGFVTNVRAPRHSNPTVKSGCNLNLWGTILRCFTTD
jgi:hypothetical protein